MQKSNKYIVAATKKNSKLSRTPDGPFNCLLMSIYEWASAAFAASVNDGSGSGWGYIAKTVEPPKLAVMIKNTVKQTTIAAKNGAHVGRENDQNEKGPPTSITQISTRIQVRGKLIA